MNIRGVFESETDKFDPKPHSLDISYNPGKIARGLLADTAVNVTKAATTGPIVGMVTDSKSDTTNERLTPGQPIKIAGSNLKIIGDPDKVGVFFVSTNDATAKKSELIVTNNPSELTLTVPELQNGWYRIRVVTNYASGGKQTKEPRANEYPISLVVGDGIDRPEEV